MLPYDTQQLTGLTLIRPMPPRALYSALLVGEGRITVVPECARAAGRGDFLSLTTRQAKEFLAMLDECEQTILRFGLSSEPDRPLASDWRIERHPDDLVTLEQGDRCMWCVGSTIDPDTLAMFCAALRLAISESRPQA
ncbi:MAG: hypothetical protein RL760_396 [Candidatus Eisenbacteria bacterium]|jgi:hypothetical protein